MYRFTVLFLLAVQCLYAQTVTVSEGEIKIPTYPVYETGYNPKFTDYEGSVIYPYTMQDDLGDERVDTTYKAVTLENEYLKIICLPQLGGRIHSVFDKTTNHEMFHRNDVIKPGLIAMRGAWISGGIEWNRGPQGHTVTSFDPVNVTTRQNEDGSASLVVGYTELNFKTRWTVILTLHPGKAYLDESIRIYNPTEGRQSYYFWNNTAFPCKPGTRFMYPMKLGQDHAGTKFFSWPMNNGVDITWLKNYDEPSSVFAYQCAFDFFGAYDVDDDRGIVQFGDHRVITGKKAWTWGQSGDGIASQRSLHDDGSQYIEVQSGPLQTQANYGLLWPRQEIAWQEYWYPVHGLGDGFEYATKDIAIQTSRPSNAADTLEVRLIGTGVFPAAKCKITSADDTSNAGAGVMETMDITPNAVHTVTAHAAANTRMTISVESASGELLARYTTPLDIPDRAAPKLIAKTPAREAHNELYIERASTEPGAVDAFREPQPVNPETAATANQYYLEGVGHEQRIEMAAAVASYQKSIETDPAHTGALAALARIEYGRGQDVSAATRAFNALKSDPDNGLAWYYLGLASLQLTQNRRPADPMFCAYKAVNAYEYAALGHDLAGRIQMRDKHFAEAVAEFDQAVRLAPTDSRAKDNLIAALFMNKQYKRANDEAARLVQDEPLDFVPRAIFALQGDAEMKKFVAFMQGAAGLYEQELIDLALYFADLGLLEQARTVLSGAYADAVPNCASVLYHGAEADLRNRPMPWYVLAWLAHASGDENNAKQYLEKAKALSPDFAFPSQREFIAILEYALTQDGNDANAMLLLGNLQASFTDLKSANALWERAAALPHASSVVLRNLAMNAWKKESNLAKASDLFAKAIAARPSDQTLYRDAATVLIADKKRPDAIVLLEKMPLDHPRRGDITVVLANAYNDEKRYDDTLHLLEESKFSNWELNTESWRAFHRAHVERGKTHFDAKEFDAALADFSTALTYPEKLGVGRSARPEESEGLYWKGKALEALNKKDEARAAWTEGSKGAEKSDTQKEYIVLCKKALGQ